MSQAGLARELDRSPASVSFWEKGQRMPGLDDILDLARLLNRPPDYFLPDPVEREAQRPEAILRAVASQLAGVELGAESDAVLESAERQRSPVGAFRPRSADPIEAAEEVLSAARQTEPPIDVKAAASLCGARVVRHRFSSDALSGFLLKLDDESVIGTNALHSARRQCFTVAHELGHLVLQHHADYHLDLTSSVSSGDPPGYDWRHERAANTFAANLLMPAGLVRRDYVDAELDPGQLATRYNASAEAMGIRVSALGLV
jgi:Zn-dependent peptidase ImmA (M78 family)